MTNCEDDDEETTISYKQRYNLSVKVWKKNAELEKIILTYKNHVKSLEYENKRIIYELNQL